MAKLEPEERTKINPEARPFRRDIATLLAGALERPHGARYIKDSIELIRPHREIVSWLSDTSMPLSLRRLAGKILAELFPSQSAEKDSLPSYVKAYLEEIFHGIRPEERHIEFEFAFKFAIACRRIVALEDQNRVDLQREIWK